MKHLYVEFNSHYKMLFTSQTSLYLNNQIFASANINLEMIFKFSFTDDAFQWMRKLKKNISLEEQISNKILPILKYTNK